MGGQRFVALVALSFPLASLAFGGEPAAPTLSRSVVPAKGRQSAVLTVPEFGRYSIRVSSSQGTGLQVVDRMGGPGSIAGVIGESDGRLDLLLDRGEYLVVTHGHERASGEAQIEAHAFVADESLPPRRLVELKPFSGSIQDLETVVYWLEVPKRRRVSLEAAGRSLADLRLWRDGQWLVDAAPVTDVLHPTQGRPLLVCRLTTMLEPGLYLVTLYGGPSQPWSEQSDQHPYYLRWGTSRLPLAARHRRVVSPFGVDRFRVPGAATYFQIELPEARPASLQVGGFDDEHPFDNAGTLEEVTKKSVPPVAIVQVGSLGDQDHVVTVTGEAGQAYVLQHFELRQSYPFTGSGHYWVSTVHSGHAADSVDATALLVDNYWRLDGPRATPVREQTIEISRWDGWQRRANLLDTLTVHLHVTTTGGYVAEGEGAQFRIEPFMVTRPDRYEPPPFRDSGGRWELDAGYYVMTVRPIRKGIATLRLYAQETLQKALSAIGLGHDPDSGPVQGAVRFPDVPLRGDRSYTLYPNRQPGVAAGVVLRPLPLDLREALPIWQRPGEEVAVPFAVDEAGTLRAEAEDGSLLELSLDGEAWQKRAVVLSGKHKVSVRVSGEETVAYSLFMEPERLDPQGPLPLLPDAALAAIPDFPVLAAGQPRPFDLARGARQTVRVAADEPGLYRLESTGLLATEGNLRSRTTTSLLRRSENGVGRNFLIQGYLREGDYQLTVTGKGRSAGHLGLSLERAELLRGGFLTSYVPARASLAPGQAVEYRFVITHPGRFRVRALGQGRVLRCRLEDKGGWPLETPNGEADVTRWFDPGHYRFVVLPEATEARVVSLIEPVTPPRRYTGHGPHRLPPERQVEHEWMEPEAGAPRVPDQWELDVPADVEVCAALEGEVVGTLVKIPEGVAKGAAETVASFSGQRCFEGRLARGRYRLDVVAARINNRLPYKLTAWPVPLVAGLSRDVTLPVEVPVAVGEEGLVELESFGSSDVRARLYDDAGALVAASDDRPGDWNFQISRSLPAGRYRLRLDPVGAATASTRVTMRRPRVIEEPALVAPASRELVLSDAARLLPLQLGSGELLLASATASEGVGLALEKHGKGGWSTLASSAGRAASFEVPLAPEAAAEGAYRLRLWSIDRRHASAQVFVAAAAPEHASEARLGSGLPATSVSGFRPPRAVAAAVLDRPGVLETGAAGREASVRWCTTVDEPCRERSDGIVAVTGKLLWLVRDRAGDRPRAHRLSLAPGSDGLFVSLPAAAPLRCDLDKSPGPVLVRARSRAGQPGVWVADGDDSGVPVFAAGEQSALAVALAPRRPVALAWRAAPADGAMETRLDSLAFPAPSRAELDYGQTDGALSERRALRLDLPKGAKQLRLALDTGLVAVVSTGERLESVHWLDEQPFAESMSTEARHLTLLHTRQAESRYAIELLPLAKDAEPAAVPAGGAFEARIGRAGRQRLDVPAAPGRRQLHVRGHAAPPLLVTTQGRVQRGPDLLLAENEGGTLIVPQTSGLLLAWSGPEGLAAQVPWPETEKQRPRKLGLPVSLALSGSAAAFDIQTETPAMLHLRAAAALATQLERAGHPPQIDVFSESVSLDAFLPDGKAVLRLRALAGSTLSETAELTTTPVTPIEEGLGPEHLLAPGATRLFSFRVDRPGPVGVGVRASADIVEVTLMRGDGGRIGSGTQMPTLEPGTYLLSLHVPSDGETVRARPAVVGLVPPDTGPPEDVVRAYIESYGRAEAHAGDDQEPAGGEQ